MRYLAIIASAATLWAVPGCLHVTMDPVEVKPITLNVNLKIDRQLDDFFAYENQLGGPTTAASSRPTTTATQASSQEGK